MADLPVAVPAVVGRAFWFLRHGETDWNARNLSQGSIDIPLNANGVAQAERAALAVMHPGRLDVIGAGALILRVIVDEFGLDEVVVSEHDILDGIALRLARG